MPTALMGIGAAKYPGRWNSMGVHLAYTAGSHSLALLEMLVHVNTSDVPEGLHLLVYEIPDDAIHDLEQALWPAGWDDLPYSVTVRQVGDAFINAGEHLALRVPSAITPGESNVLINPAHPRFGEITRVSDGPLAPDSRLFG